MKNVHNVFGTLLKTILKIRNSRFYDNFYNKIFIMLPVFDELFEFFFGKDNILNFIQKTYNVVFKKKKIG